MNHAEIGARISEKWNFPESLVAAIRYHHEPSLVPGEYRDVVHVVYLANIFCEYEAGNVTYEQIEPSVLHDYGFTSEKHFKAVVDKMSEGFKLESGRAARDSGPRK